jgi:UDP-N-acetylmuramate: L-alanyl-gamma-D-glutamyl-meso-diaminopimelate ligase
MKPLKEKVKTLSDFDALLTALKNTAQKGDHILIMSNGGFNGIHNKLLDLLKTP